MFSNDVLGLVLISGRVLRAFGASTLLVNSMDFYLPRFTLGATRFVYAGERLWELWSPNSQRFAFYPGVSKPNLRLGRNLDLELRRADGQFGRFDPTASPQHFDQTSRKLKNTMTVLRKKVEPSRCHWRS